MAERLGFEPRIRVTPDNGFRDRRIRPLCHLSQKMPTSLQFKNFWYSILIQFLLQLIYSSWMRTVILIEHKPKIYCKSTQDYLNLSQWLC